MSTPITPIKATNKSSEVEVTSLTIPQIEKQLQGFIGKDQYVVIRLMKKDDNPALLDNNCFVVAKIKNIKRDEVLGGLRIDFQAVDNSKLSEEDYIKHVEKSLKLKPGTLAKHKNPRTGENLVVHYGGPQKGLYITNTDGSFNVLSIESLLEINNNLKK